MRIMPGSGKGRATRNRGARALPRRAAAAVRWLAAAVILGSGTAAAGEIRFTDDFESGLASWTVVGGEAVEIVDTGDPAHGRVLQLRPDGLVYALVKGSDAWGPVRVEADFLFPEERGNYFGLIYNHARTDGRTDFGSVYIKGDGSYIRANPWRAGNASRLLYEEYRTALTGDDAIRIGAWHRLKAEIVGNTCHLYVGEGSAPKLTFDLYEGARGLVGFKARIAGTSVRVDNVRVTAIDRPAWDGPPVPAIAYHPEELLTDWEAIGPFAGPVEPIERAAGSPATRVGGARGSHAWRPFPADRRGAIVTGRLTEYEGTRPVAYLRTVVRADRPHDAVLHFSTLDELAVWVNGRFQGFVYRNGYMEPEPDWNAWYDFATNPEHAASRIGISLREGDNRIVVRVRNGQFASGGFFARLEED